MAKMIPEKLPEQVLNAGEIELFCKLRDEAGTRDWTALRSVSFCSELPNGIDFIVLVPHHGIVCIDVVSAARVTRENGQWFCGSKGVPPSPDPFSTLHREASALRSFLIGHDPALAGVPIACAVIFTRAHAEVISRGGPPTWPEQELIDTNKFLFNPMSKLAQELLEKARLEMGEDALATALLSDLHCEKIANVLRSWEPTGGGDSAERELTIEQSRALVSIERNPRMVVTGAAGTGKTFLALEAARRAAEGSEKVLVLCFNRLMRDRMREQAASDSIEVAVRTMHEHMLLTAGLTEEEAEERATREEGFLERVLPALASERLAAGQASEHVFPRLIVDEAQEMLLDAYFDVIELSMAGGMERGRWVIFGDFDDRGLYQRGPITIRDVIYNRCKYIPHFYSLNTNCRSSKSIAEFVNRLISRGLYSETLSERHTPSPRVLYYGSSEEQRRLLLECLEELGRDGYASDDLVVISGRADGETVARTIDDPSWRPRLRPISSQDREGVRFGSVRDFQGLDAPAIIVTDVEELEKEPLLYQAITRARERLIVLSHVSQREKLENDSNGA